MTIFRHFKEIHRQRQDSVQLLVGDGEIRLLAEERIFGEFLDWYAETVDGGRKSDRVLSESR
jgi:hypothetical protein